MLTLNCHSLQGFDTQKQIMEIVDQIVREKVTIFALQEANQPQDTPIIAAEILRASNYIEPKEINGKKIREGNFAYLLQCALKKVKLEFNWSWCAGHQLLDKYDEGLALFSLGELQDVSADEIVIESKSHFDNIRGHKILSAKLCSCEETLLVTTHLDGQTTQRFTLEWDSFYSKLKKLGVKCLPTYVLANFNVDAEEDRVGYEYMCQELQDTYVKAISKGDGMTVRGQLDGWGKKEIARRIDYILTNAKDEISSSRICFDGYESQKISDHAGVIIEVECSPKQSLA